MTVTRFQQKRGTSAQWAASVTPLRDGEFGIDKDTGLIKVGDGFTLWADLPAAFESQYLPLLGKAKDSYRLDGLASTDFLRSNGKAVDSDKLDGLDSTAFLPVNGTAADSAKLGGQLPAFYMPASAAASFLAASGKAADADKLDGIDSTGFALAAETAQTSGTRKLTSYFGSGTSFPTAGVLPGDEALRSDVGTGGSLWVYVAPGKGVGGWVHKGVLTCTSATRPASAMCYDGLEIFETDTKAIGVYDATASKWRMFDTVWQSYTPSLWSTTAVGASGYNVGMYMRRGQEVVLRTSASWSGAGAAYGAGNFQIGIPIACSTSPNTTIEIEMLMKVWNAVGNTIGFAITSHGLSVMTLYGIGASNNSSLGILTTANPSGWTTGHNIFVTGSYPIA